MKKYLTLVLPLLVFSFIFAQDEADTPTEAVEEAVEAVVEVGIDVEPEAETATDAAEESIEVEEEIIEDDFSDFGEEEDAAGKTSPIIGVSLTGGLPIYSATYLSGYSAGVGGGLTLHTYYGFNVGPLSFTTDVNVLYVDYSVGNNTGLDEFSNLGVFAQINTNTSDLLSFIPAATSIHLGAGILPGNGMGFNAGGGLELPLNLPVGVGLVGNATISQTPGGGITGWLAAGLGISKTF